MAHCDRGAHSAGRRREKRSSLRHARWPSRWPSIVRCLACTTVQRPLFPVSGRQKRSRRLHYTLFSIVQLDEADEAQPRVRSIAVIVNIPTGGGPIYHRTAFARLHGSLVLYPILIRMEHFFFTRIIKETRDLLGNLDFFFFTRSDESELS